MASLRRDQAAEAVRRIDPGAFTVIMESNEVLGEGFRSIRVAQPPRKKEEP